jgi:hypothetical protein
VPPEAERDTEDPPAKAAMIKFLALSFRLPEPFWGGVDEILEHPRLQDVEDLEFEGLSALDIDDDKIGLLGKWKTIWDCTTQPSKSGFLQRPSIPSMALEPMLTPLQFSSNT